MTKKILIWEVDYQPASLITKEALEKGWFTQQLECSSNQHICLSDWTRKLILEILGNKENPENFKIFDIN